MSVQTGPFLLNFIIFFPIFLFFFKKFTKANFVLEGWQLQSIFLQVCTILKLLLLSKYHHKRLSNECTNWTRFVDFYHFYHILMVFAHCLSCFWEICEVTVFAESSQPDRQLDTRILKIGPKLQILFSQNVWNIA